MAEEFTEETGSQNIDKDASEYEIFAKFFDDDVIRLLVDETNKYYDQVIEKSGGIEALKKFCRFRDWTKSVLLQCVCQLVHSHYALQFTSA